MHARAPRRPLRPSAHHGAPWWPETVETERSQRRPVGWAGDRSRRRLWGVCSRGKPRCYRTPSSAHVLVRRSRRIVQAAGFDVFVRTDAWTRHGVGVGEDSLRIKYGIGE